MFSWERSLALRKPLPQATASIETERVGEMVLLTRMRGHMTRDLAEQNYKQFQSLVVAVKQPHWIIEQLELTGFDPGAVPAGARWFNTFKECGGQHVIFVSPLAAARMVAASLAFAAHAKISSCDTLEAACERVGVKPPAPRPSLLSPKPSSSD